jgi:hypothetical protein
MVTYDRLPAWADDRILASKNVAQFFAGHQQRTERALTAVRRDAFLDDRRKSQLITQVIAAANARAVEILARRQQLTPS